MAKMSIHRGLSELKLIDTKIAKHIEAITPTGIRQKDKPINGYYDEAKFTSNAQSNYDAVIGLMKRKLALKSAIVKANGETTVTVGGKEMTVADAINMKALIAIKKQFITNLKSKVKTTTGEFNRVQDIVNKNLQTILEATLGKDNVKTNKEDVENVTKPFLEINSYTLFDPLKIEDKIAELEKEIDDFTSEVDAVLSESNATTEIEVAE